jgi:predicted ATPase
MTGREMQLAQTRVYRSIKTLGKVDVPPFTVLTGLNGSGKSHLLEAIANGSVAVDLAPDFRRDIQLHTWATLVPNDVGITNISGVHQHRDWFVGHVRNRKTERTNDLFDKLREFGIDSDFSHDPWSALQLGREELIARSVPEQRVDELVNTLLSFERDLLHSLRSGIGQDEERLSLLSELQSSDTRLHTLHYTDFDRRAFSYYGRNLFQHSFGQMFFAYFDKQRANRNRRMDEIDGRTPSTPSLTDDEFVTKNGPPPWDFVNSTLERARLDFRIDHPVEYESTEYLPRLTKVSSGVDVQFSSLSSGEKILMSFALCLYNSTDRRQQVNRPKVLLLDEIDASLHPSMSRTLISIIDEVLVRQEGISVILVTHSPSTVAVSPEQSIYLLEPLTNRISHETKRRAVATLTAEIPTMSIDFSGRRQVMVESEYDAERYGLAYQILSPFISSERSLTFIGVGNSYDGTGSAKVISTVSALVAAENISTFGLIDWDLKNTSTSRICVLGENDRYAIENYLLDPIMIAAVVIYTDPHRFAEVGLSEAHTFATLSDLSCEVMQNVVETIQKRVLGDASILDGVISATYANGCQLTLSRIYAECNGHKLEEAVIKAFPLLQRYNGTGKLLRQIINVVIRNHPKLVPKRLLDDLAWLCDTEIV